MTKTKKITDAKYLYKIENGLGRQDSRSGILFCTVFYLFFILFSLCSIETYSQSEKEIDSLINVMCEEIQLSSGQSDSSILLGIYGKHFFPFLDARDEKERQKIEERIFYRFQRNCADFSDLLDRLQPPEEDWIKVLEKPKNKLKKAECRNFILHRSFKYLESNGDSVLLTIEDNIWIDRFKDGTYSKLKFKWIDNCDFEIEFIESNNKIRQQFGKPGDRYRYQVIDHAENFYIMSVRIMGRDEGYYVFKMFYQ